MRASASRGPTTTVFVRGVGAQRVERPLGDDAEPAALPGREPPVPVVLADARAPSLVDDRAGVAASPRRSRKAR